MNNLRKAVILGQAIRRQMSSKVVEVPSKRFAHLKEVQAKMGVEDGLPSYLKGGFGDRMLLSLTVLLTAIGVGMSGEVLYKLSYPRTD